MCCLVLPERLGGVEEVVLCQLTGVNHGGAGLQILSRVC